MASCCVCFNSLPLSLVTFGGGWREPRQRTDTPHTNKQTKSVQHCPPLISLAHSHSSSCPTSRTGGASPQRSAVAPSSLSSDISIPLPSQRQPAPSGFPCCLRAGVPGIGFAAIPQDLPVSGLPAAAAHSSQHTISPERKGLSLLKSSHFTARMPLFLEPCLVKCFINTTSKHVPSPPHSSTRPPIH